MGAYVRPNGFVAPDRTAAFLPGPYRVEHFDIELRCVLTNKTPVGSYRGPGRVESTFVRERAIDLIAQELDLDPADVRRRNFIAAADMPYRVGTTAHNRPVIYDTGDYPAQFERALERIGYESLKSSCEAARKEGRAVGVGIGCFVETSGIGQADTEIVDHADATLYVMTSEYGAQTQLEKIDMIDFADVIAINKFDKRGSEDALRTC